jgi:competence ComEA-like helix-hairpin-helix protein
VFDLLTEPADAVPGKRMSRRKILFVAPLCLMLALSGAFTIRAQHKKQPPAAPLDLNAATPQQLQELPGVGRAMAKSIVDFRKKSGPFRRVEDLLAIRGITTQRLEKIRPYVKIIPPNAKNQNTNP